MWICCCCCYCYYKCRTNRRRRRRLPSKENDFVESVGIDVGVGVGVAVRNKWFRPECVGFAIYDYNPHTTVCHLNIVIAVNIFHTRIQPLKLELGKKESTPAMHHWYLVYPRGKCRIRDGNSDSLYIHLQDAYRISDVAKVSEGSIVVVVTQRGAACVRFGAALRSWLRRLDGHRGCDTARGSTGRVRRRCWRACRRGLRRCRP